MLDLSSCVNADCPTVLDAISDFSWDDNCTDRPALKLASSIFAISARDIGPFFLASDVRFSLV